MSDYIISIASSTESGSVAIHHRGKIVKSSSAHCIDRTGSLILLLNQLLKEQRLTLQQCSAIAIQSGGGSYIGSRIVTTLGKAICYTNGLQLIVLPIWSVLLQSYSPLKFPLIMMVGGGKRYTNALFLTSLNSDAKPSRIFINELATIKTKQNKKIYCFGDGADRFSSFITELQQFIWIKKKRANADNMGKLAWETYLQKNYVDIYNYHPNYPK